MHYGEKVIMKYGKVASLLVKELIREVGAKEEECKHMSSKFKDQANLVDNNARTSIKKT